MRDPWRSSDRPFSCHRTLGTQPKTRLSCILCKSTNWPSGGPLAHCLGSLGDGLGARAVHFSCLLAQISRQRFHLGPSAFVQFGARLLFKLCRTNLKVSR